MPRCECSRSFYGSMQRMTRFTHLEISAVFPYTNEEGKSYCEALWGLASGVLSLECLLEVEDDPKLIFFTVYGCYPSGLAEAICDVESLSEASHVATELRLLFQHVGETELN